MSLKDQDCRDEEIKQKYSKIFRSSSQNSFRTICFECNSGWFDLIDLLCNKIQDRVDSLSIPQVVALQVKEKFGGLRFYSTGGDEVTRAYVEFAESLSYKICETCGAPGSQKTIGCWIHTSCESCFEKRQWRQKNEEQQAK